MDLAVRADDWTAFDTLNAMRYRGQPLPVAHRLVLALVRGDSSVRGPALDEAKRNSHELYHAALDLGSMLEDLAGAERFAAAGVGPDRTLGFRDSMYQYLALVQAGEGRWRDANASLSALRHVPGSTAWLMRGFLAALPFLDVPKADLEEIQRELRDWDPRADPPDAASAPETALGPQLRLWLLARLDMRLGADARALEHAAELERLDISARFRPTARSMAQTIRAELLARHGRAQEALDALAPVQGRVPLALVNVAFYAEEPARWLRIGLLRSLGREDEALEWLRNGFAATPTELVYLAPLYREQAQIYDRGGDRARARENYARFVGLWKACDPGLRPALEDARGRLAQLVEEPR